MCNQDQPLLGTMPISVAAQMFTRQGAPQYHSYVSCSPYVHKTAKFRYSAVQDIPVVSVVVTSKMTVSCALHAYTSHRKAPSCVICPSHTYK